MTVWFVSRHDGALEWAKERGILDDSQSVKVVSGIDVEQVALDDYVIGTLPVHLVADICARGAHYLHIAMQVPAGRRGSELSAAEMVEFGATVREFLVLPSADDNTALATPPLPQPGQGVHVCLVSDQHMANLLPILKRQPAHVALICTPEMAQSGRGAEKLLIALQRFGYGASRVSRHNINGAASTDFPLAREVASTLRQQLLATHPGQPLTLNATGGTKILSSAFFLAFHGCEIIYTDSQQGNCIRFMSNRARREEPLGSQITRIEDYLHCQGYAVDAIASESPGYVQRARQHTETTNRLAGYSGQALSKMNEAAQKFLKDIFGAKMGKHMPEEQKAAALNKALPSLKISTLKGKDLGLCEELLAATLLIGVKGGGYAFANADAMKYLTGGWIEEWAWAVATDCRPDACASGVTIRALAGQAKQPHANEADNELDLIVLHGNRLLIAECKTINWSGGNARQEIFNKLDALSTHARGLFGKSLLISAKALDEKALRRAKAYGIQTIEGKSLQDLKKEILKWMGHQQPVGQSPMSMLSGGTVTA